MRNLKANVQTVFFKNYMGETEIVDEYGNKTGSYNPAYSELKSVQLCVSPNKGASEVQMFGSLENYDRTMTTSDTTVAIDENSILWVDANPNNSPHDYIVRRKAPWKNSVSFAIQKVRVTNATQSTTQQQQH